MFTDKIKSFFSVHKDGSHVVRYDNIEIYPDDIFLVAYPKSGITWIRFLIANYLTGNKCNFDNHPFLIPDIHYNPEQYKNVSRPRFIKSHFSFTPQFYTKRYPKVIYIVRDGRDVAVSYYYYLIRIGFILNTTTFEEYLFMFNQGTINKYSNWNLHVNSWLDNAPDNFLVIRYEDVHKYPEDNLSLILDFSGIKVDADRVSKAVLCSKFENMQQQEKTRSRFFSRKKVAVPAIPFVRTGKVGNWKDMLTGKLYKEFLHVHNEALRRLNYLQ